MRSLPFLLLNLLIQISCFAQNFDWVGAFRGAGDETVNAIISDASGNVYICGSFIGVSDLNPGTAQQNLTSAGGFDAFLCKLDANGNFIWVKQFGGKSDESAEYIQLDALGNIYLAGQYSYTTELDPGPGSVTFSAPSQYSDVFILKLDTSGNLNWAKSFGGTASDIPMGLKLTSNGNLAIAGDFAHTVDFDPGPGTYTIGYMNDATAYINVLDTAGNFQFARVFAGNNISESQGLDIDGFNNIYLCGLFWGTNDFNPGSPVYNLSSAGYPDIFILKLDAAGNFEWAKSFGGTWIDTPNGICTDPQGNVIVTGFFNNSFDFDPGPAVLTFSSTNGFDGFVSKFDTYGNLTWAKALFGTNSVTGEKIQTDYQGSVLVCGQFKGTFDMDPGIDSVFVTSNGQEDVFLMKLNATGNFEWGGKIGGDQRDFANTLHKTSTGSLYCGGYFGGSGDFDPFTGQSFLTSLGYSDGYILKLSDPFLGNQENSGRLQSKLYPNPVQNDFTLYLNEAVKVKIYDLYGQEIMSVQTESGINKINLSGINNGIYILHFLKNNTVYGSERIIVSH